MSVDLVMKVIVDMSTNTNIDTIIKRISCQYILPLYAYMCKYKHD